MQKRILASLIAGALIATCAPAAAQDAAAVGEEVYEQHCQSCHGEKLRSAGAIPDLRELGANDREKFDKMVMDCLLYTSPSPRDRQKSRMPSSA